MEKTDTYGRQLAGSDRRGDAFEAGYGLCPEQCMYKGIDDRIMKYHLLESVKAETMLVQLVDSHSMSVMASELEEIKRNTEREFCLLACEVDDWNRDLSPWEAPAVFGDTPFGGEANRTLEGLREELETKYKDKNLIIGGYSLAGLFALWAAYRTDAFCGVAAASPSVWFPGFLKQAEENRVLTDIVYLSLGDKEEKTRNPVMATVGDSIKTLNQLYQKQPGMKTVLEWNPGNHFKEPDIRMAKAFAWVMNELERQ